MQINGLVIIVLAGFAAIAAAQPHKHHLHARHAVGAHEAAAGNTTTTVDQYGNANAKPTGSPHENNKKPGAGVSKSVKDEGVKNAVSSASDIDCDFPDGTISCSEFPSDYGAIKTDWITKDGWSSIQKDGGNDDHIGVCTDGALCNYACRAGYSKAQWPEEQPLSGESWGGLRCKNGKLYKTSSSYQKLCRAGKGTAKVVNKLDKNVSICRTDYPGRITSHPCLNFGSCAHSYQVPKTWLFHCCVLPVPRRN